MIKTFDPPRTIVRRLVEAALTEDLGLLGDITTIACIVEDHTAVAAFVSREEGVLAGTAFVTETYRQLDATAGIEWALRDGESVDAGTELGRVTGSLRAILAGERTASNVWLITSNGAPIYAPFTTSSAATLSVERRHVQATFGSVTAPIQFQVKLK